MGLLTQSMVLTMTFRRIIKTCTWQILGVIWFMSYAVVTGGDLWYTLGLSLASIPAGSIMFYTHEWVWDKLDISKLDKY